MKKWGAKKGLDKGKYVCFPSAGLFKPAFLGEKPHKIPEKPKDFLKKVKLGIDFMKKHCYN